MNLAIHNLVQQTAAPIDFVIKPNLLFSQSTIFDFGSVTPDNFSEEQFLLKRIRENRIIDSFVGFSCFSNLPRPRTTISKDIKQIVDEVYFGKNRFGHSLAISVIAITSTILLRLSFARNIYEIYQSEFPNLLCIPIFARLIEQNVVAFWTFHHIENQFSIDTEKHYRLVRPDELSNEELANYRGQE